MQISQAFPAKFLKSEDVGNQRFTLTIRDVQMEDVGDNETKPVIYFQGMEKGMVLNKTNADMIVHLYGDETQVWNGRQVELYTTPVQFQGRSTMGLRVMAPAPQMPAHQGVTTPQVPGQPPYQPPGMPNLNTPPPHAPGMPEQRQVYQAPDPNAPQGGGGFAPPVTGIDKDEVPFSKCIH